jgi:hypothetical protein
MRKDLDLFSAADSRGEPISYTMGALLLGLIRLGSSLAGVAVLVVLLAQASAATQRAGVRFDMIAAWPAAQTMMERAGLLLLGGAMAALLLGAAYGAVSLVQRWRHLWKSQEVSARRRALAEVKIAIGILLVAMAMYGAWTSLEVLARLPADASAAQVLAAILAQGWFTGTCGLLGFVAGCLVPLTMVGMFLLVIVSACFEAGQQRQ